MWISDWCEEILLNTRKKRLPLLFRSSSTRVWQNFLKRHLMISGISFDFHKKVRLLSRWNKKACESYRVAEDLFKIWDNQLIKSVVKLLHSLISSDSKMNCIVWLRMIIGQLCRWCLEQHYEADITFFFLGLLLVMSASPYCFGTLSLVMGGGRCWAKEGDLRAPILVDSLTKCY